MLLLLFLPNGTSGGGGATSTITLVAESGEATLKSINVNPRDLHESNRNWQRLAALGILTQQSDFSGTLSLGTAAMTASNSYLATASNLSDITNAGSARSHLGIGTVGTVNTASLIPLLGTPATVADATGAGDVVAQLNAALAVLRSFGIIT